jgi:hypothetical protein
MATVFDLVVHQHAADVELRLFLEDRAQIAGFD